MSATGQTYSVEISVQKALVNLLLVYLLLFISGTWRYMLSSDMFLVAAQFITLLAWFIYSDRRISERFLIYMVVFCGLLIALYLYTGGSLSLPSVIASAMKVFIAYLIIRTVDERFAETYINVIVFLAVVSLFGYLTDIFSLFDVVVRRLPAVGDYGYEGFLYLYRYSWQMGRNNSIFFEPGAYQGFLNAALFILFFVKTNFSTKRTWVYIGVLMVTLVTTFSTTGILIFSVMFGMVIYKSKVVSGAAKIKIVSALLVILALFSSQFYSTFVYKVEEYLAAGEYDQDSSGKIRSAQAQTDLKIFKEHVFGVGQQKYREEFGLVGKFDLTEENTSSNGVTKTLAVYGLPFSLFIFGSYFWAMKRMLGETSLAVIAFAMLIMFLAGESYYMSEPITFSIIAGAFVYRSSSLLQARMQTT